MAFTLYHTEMLPGLPDKQVFEQDNLTVGDFFQQLSAEHGDHVLEKILDGEGKVSEDVLLAINGIILRPSEILTRVIPAGSQMLISVLIAGG